MNRDSLLSIGEARPDIVTVTTSLRDTGTVVAKFDGPCTRFYSENQGFYDNIDDLDNAIGGL